MKIIKFVSLTSLLTIGFVSVSSASIDKNLKYGQRDKEVTELQEFLIDKGLLKTNPSNFFGSLTLRAIKAYQTSVGISSTGYVGILTRQKINDELAIELASSTQAEIQETGTTTVSSNSQSNNSAVTVPTVAPVTIIATSAPSAPIQQPQVIIVQIPAPTPTPTPISQPVQIEKLYTITKNGSIIKDNINEQAVRDFAGSLNQQINWRKQMQIIKLFPENPDDASSVASGLKANDYILLGSN